MSIRQVSISNSASKQTIRKVHRYKFTNLSLSYEVRKKLYEMLISFDDNINYQFQKQQIKQALIQILQQTQSQVSYVINNVFRYDFNHDGIVTYQQFSNFCLEQHFGEMAIQRLHKQKIYSRGHQRIMNYQQFCKTLNYCLSFISIVPKQDIVRSIFIDVDTDNNGYISYSEYFTFLKEYFGSQSQSATIVTVNTVEDDLKKIYGNVDKKKMKQDIFKEKKQKLQKLEEQRKQKEMYQAQQRLRRSNGIPKIQHYKPQTTKSSSGKKLDSTNNLGKQSTTNFQPFKSPFSSTQNLSSSQATPSNVGRNSQQIKPSFQSTQKLQQTNKTSLQQTRNSQQIKPSISTQNLQSTNLSNLTTSNNLQQVKLGSQTVNNKYKSPLSSQKQKNLNELKTIGQKISKLIYQQLKLTILQQDKKMQLNSTSQSATQFLTNIFKIPNIKVNKIIKQIFKDQSTINYQQLLKYTLQNYISQNLTQKNRYPLNKQQFIISNLNNLYFIKIKPYRFLFEELFEKYTSQKNKVDINRQEYQQLMNIIFKDYNWPRLTGQLRKKEPIYIV